MDPGTAFAIIQFSDQCIKYGVSTPTFCRNLPCCILILMSKGMDRSSCADVRIIATPKQKPES